MCLEENGEGCSGELGEKLGCIPMRFCMHIGLVLIGITSVGVGDRGKGMLVRKCGRWWSALLEKW